MTRYICETCGTQFEDAAHPPAHCPICEDERQYVGWRGQTWTTHDTLKTKHRLRIEDDGGVLGIGLAPAFSINQRALFLPTDAGNILWECVSLVTDEAIAALRARGAIDMIAISHPHFYSSMVEWSDAFGGVPIFIHESDRQWVQRASSQIHYWSGDMLKISRDVTLIRCGGHFPGSTALHWSQGPRPGGALFPGDALQVAMDRRHVAFMYSYPNAMPMRPSDVRAIAARLDGVGFDNVFGFAWGRNIVGQGRAAVDASVQRFLDAISA